MARQHSHRGGPTRILLLLLAAGVVVTAGAGVAVAAQDEFEPNDEPDAAAQIDDGTYEGLTIAGGVDYYEVDLSAGETLEVTTEFTHDDGDIDLRLYDSDERPIAESASYEDQESVSHTAEEDETIQIMVYTEGRRSNDYTMTVSTEGGSTQSDDGSDGDSDGDSSTDSGDAGSDGDGSDDADGSDGSDGDDSGGDDGLPGFGVLAAIGGLAAVGLGAVARER